MKNNYEFGKIFSLAKSGKNILKKYFGRQKSCKCQTHLRIVVYEKKIANKLKIGNVVGAVSLYKRGKFLRKLSWNALIILNIDMNIFMGCYRHLPNGYFLVISFWYETGAAKCLCHLRIDLVQLSILAWNLQKLLCFTESTGYSAFSVLLLGQEIWIYRNDRLFMIPLNLRMP